MGVSEIIGILQNLKNKVDEYILNEVPSGHEIPEIDLLYTMMRDYPSRSGKGIRPGLVMIFNRAFGGSDDAALNTAAALELFQNWIVIHDDIEDESTLRRGLPALHVKYGIPLAINAGDALAGKMWELILKNQSILGLEKTMIIFGEFLHMYSQTTSGQHIELAWAKNRRWDITAGDYFEMCRRKTAWYTCITPAWTGSVIAGADFALKDVIIKFGMDLGVAFQIQDDVLNLVGSKEKYGKEIGGDILEGKRTLVLIDLLARCTVAERQSVIESLDRDRCEKNEGIVDDVMSLVNKYGCLEDAIRVSQDLARNARTTIISSLDGSIDAGWKAVIIDLVDFVVNREF